MSWRGWTPAAAPHCGQRGHPVAGPGIGAPTISTVTQADGHSQTSDWPTAAVAQARWFRALADPTRLTILKYLLAGPHTVTELVDLTGVPQSRVSNHLACLRWCRFVHADRQGRHVVYTIADTQLKRGVRSRRGPGRLQRRAPGYLQAHRARLDLIIRRGLDPPERGGSIGSRRLWTR